jgi:hypothetical protein
MRTAFLQEALHLFTILVLARRTVIFGFPEKMYTPRTVLARNCVVRGKGA